VSSLRRTLPGTCRDNRRFIPFRSRIMRWLLPLFAAIALTACSAAPQAHANGQVDKLTVIDHTVGTGPEAKAGMDVLVHYTGWVYDKDAKDHHGTKFDSSRDSGTPFSFPLGAGRVIPGWDQGVAGMRVGGRRRLTIPPELAYGSRGAGGVIGPNETLVFVVDLLGVS
jgi:FKBP-type peptidyl-prolyl cis-trans isomerase FkpA